MFFQKHQIWLGPKDNRLICLHQQDADRRDRMFKAVRRILKKPSLKEMNDESITRQVPVIDERKAEFRQSRLKLKTIRMIERTTNSIAEKKYRNFKKENLKNVYDHLNASNYK